MAIYHLAAQVISRGAGRNAVNAAAYRRGARVPADLSVVGFDDLAIASFFTPPLTTVRQPMRQMGRLAAETLLSLLANRAAGATVRVPAELVVRESTAPPSNPS